MPIYEYACGKCGRVSSFLVRNTAAHEQPACPHCGSRRMNRALSRFAAVSPRKTSGGHAGGDEAPPDGAGTGGDFGDEAGMPDMAGMESMLESVDENDPRSMGRAMRTLAEQTGEPLDAEMDEVVRRLEAGEDPERIEEKMGDAFGGEGAGGGAGDALYDG